MSDSATVVDRDEMVARCAIPSAKIPLQSGSGEPVRVPAVEFTIANSVCVHAPVGIRSAIPQPASIGERSTGVGLGAAWICWDWILRRIQACPIAAMRLAVVVFLGWDRRESINLTMISFSNRNTGAAFGEFVRQRGPGSRQPAAHQRAMGGPTSNSHSEGP